MPMIDVHAGAGTFAEKHKLVKLNEFADFQKAIQHVSRAGKTGIVLLNSPS